MSRGDIHPSMRLVRLSLLLLLVAVGVPGAALADPPAQPPGPLPSPVPAQGLPCLDVDSLTPPQVEIRDEC